MTEQRLPLDEALSLRGPHQLNRAPTAYSYNRARSIGDDRFWLDVLADCGVTEDQLEERLGIARRELFERS